MPTIGEMAPQLLTVRPEPRPEPENTVPHLYWGEPPDLDTCDQWMATVLSRYETIGREMANAKVGERIRDSTGRVLRHDEYVAWRGEQSRRLQQAMRRYRWLKHWRAERTRRPENPDLKPIRTTHGQAFKAASRRLGTLENLFDALREWVREDTDDAWNALMTALNDAEARDERND